MGGLIVSLNVVGFGVLIGLVSPHHFRLGGEQLVPHCPRCYAFGEIKLSAGLGEWAQRQIVPVWMDSRGL